MKKIVDIKILSPKYNQSFYFIVGVRSEDGSHQLESYASTLFEAERLANKARDKYRLNSLIIH